MAASHPIATAFALARPLHKSAPAAFLRACRVPTTQHQRRQSSSVPQITSHRKQTPNSLAVVHRSFSTTPQPHATIAILNPRTSDETGAPLTITITTRAAKRLLKIISSPAKKNTLVPQSAGPDSHLRVTVTAGGCHGFQYLMSLEDGSKVEGGEEGDTVFEYRDEDSETGTEEGKRARVVMDQASLEILSGSTVDFKSELIGSSFEVVNPRAKSECGCGTSFDID